jgi:carboxyl-terminal processing protease
MKKNILLLLILLSPLFFQGCSSSSATEDYTEASDEKQFVWNGLNHWYFWQDVVADLADNRFRSSARVSHTT